MKKTVLALLIISNVYAGSDYNLMSDAIEYLIEQTQNLEASVQRISKENKELKEALRSAGVQKKCDCEKIENELIAHNAKISELQATKTFHEKKLQKLEKQYKELKQRKQLAAKSDAESTNSKQKLLAEQKKRLEAYIKSRKTSSDASLK